MKVQNLKNNKIKKITNKSSVFSSDRREVQNIKILLSAEHRNYVEDIEKCFDDLNIKVEAGYVRKSIEELPMQVLIFLTGTITTGVTWDLIKIGIKKVLKKFKKVGIRITDRNQNTYNINPEGQINIFLVPNGKTKVISNIENIDDLFKHLENQNNWQKVKLRDVVSVIGGFAFKGKHFCNDGDSYVVKIKDIKPPFISLQEAVKINMSYYKEQELEKFKLKKGDFVVAMTGATIGKIGKLTTGDKVYINQRVAKLEHHFNINKKFIYYAIKHDDFQLFVQNNIDSHSAQENISARSIGNYPILLPPLPEQKAIAEVLSSLDDKIELLHKQNKTLENIAQTLFHKWFIEDAKKTWEEKFLDDVLSVKGGTTPNTKNPKYWNGEILWTTPKDLSKNQYIYLFNTNKKITEFGLKQISSGLLPAGTLLLSSRAPIGYLAFSVHPIAINQGYIAIIDNKGLPKEIIYLWLKSNMEYIKSHAEGSTFLEINKSSFKKLKIKLPSQRYINIFCDLIEPLFKKIFMNSNQIRELEKTRDTLLPKFMSGKVKVKCLN